jgi:hypothetical protein
VTIWAALAGGFVGTLVLTTSMRAATELRLTRIDLPFLLGTAFTPTNSSRRPRLRAALRLRARVRLRLLRRLRGDQRRELVAGRDPGRRARLFAGSALVNLLLPLVHPRMGTRLTDATRLRSSSPPAFCWSTTGRGRRPSWSPPM